MDCDLGGLFERHYLGLVRLALRLVRDQATAEDLVQEVFARLARRPVAIDDATLYLRRAVVNGSRSPARREKTIRLLMPRFIDRAVAEPADADSMHHAHRRQMLDSIAQLPQRQREVVVLRYYEELSVGEIAAVLGILAPAVSSAIQRAFTSLAQTVGENRD